MNVDHSIPPDVSIPETTCKSGFLGVALGQPPRPQILDLHISPHYPLEFFYIDGLVCLYRATAHSASSTNSRAQRQSVIKRNPKWQHRSPLHNRVARSGQGKTGHLLPFLPPFPYTSALLYPSPCPPHPALRSNSLKSSGGALYCSWVWGRSPTESNLPNGYNFGAF